MPPHLLDGPGERPRPHRLARSIGGASAPFGHDGLDDSRGNARAPGGGKTVSVPRGAASALASSPAPWHRRERLGIVASALASSRAPWHRRERLGIVASALASSRAPWHRREPRRAPPAPPLFRAGARRARQPGSPAPVANPAPNGFVGNDVSRESRPPGRSPPATPSPEPRGAASATRTPVADDASEPTARRPWTIVSR
jgi:hypothetical protein